MGRNLAWVLVAIGLLLGSSVFATAERGTEQNPYPGKGPLGKWVKNDRWAMRVTKVEYVKDAGRLAALPWTRRLTPKKRERIFKYVGETFVQDGQLVLVTLEAKNLNPGKYDIGVTYPYWVVRTDDGQESSLSDGIKDGEILKVNKSELMYDISFCLKGGFPQREKLNPGAKTGGVIPFVIPSYAQARLLYFVSNHRYGKDQSLVIDLLPK